MESPESAHAPGWLVELLGIIGCTVVGMSVFGALALIVWLLAHPRNRP